MVNRLPVSTHPAVTPAEVRRSATTGSLPHAFAPVHKRALGVAVGCVAGLGLFALTAFHVVLLPTNAPNIALLAHFFYGYEVSWRGALVGFCWAGFTGFVAGWFVAFVHNLVTALKVFAFRTRGELAQTKDFLDHI
jgi:hypothetical protein